MAWIEKAQSSPFDRRSIDGLFFLSGDLIADRPPFAWAKGEKCATIALPSGLTFTLWEATDNDEVLVNLGHNVAIPLFGTRDHAFVSTVLLAEESGFWVRPAGESLLGYVRPKTGRALVSVYDNEAKRLVNVEHHVYLSSTW